MCTLETFGVSGIEHRADCCTFKLTTDKAKGPLLRFAARRHVTVCPLESDGARYVQHEHELSCSTYNVPAFGAEQQPLTWKNVETFYRLKLSRAVGKVLQRSTTCCSAVHRSTDDIQNRTPFLGEETSLHFMPSPAKAA